ncbi:hypothetical protein [Sphingomonas sp.]|uniref:hypothetical protein n=1 Tax=Sphingomonas sp. TaxID=28214 RepID=UPI003B00CB69
MRYTTAIIAGCALLAACNSKHGDGNTAAGNTAAGNTAASSFEQGFRSSYRTRFVDSCTAGAKAAAAKQANAAVANANFTPLCSCAADKLLATKSVKELMAGPTQADQETVTKACLKEHPIGA